MYVTHGDTIVIRSDRSGRFGTSSLHGRRPDHGPHRPAAEGGDRVQSLLQRIEVLEDRVTRLEARLARAGEAAGFVRRTGGDRGEPGGHRGDRPRTEGYRPDGRGYGERDGSGGPGAGYRAPRGDGGYRTYGGGGDGQVRVTLQAGSGAHVGLGEVRFTQHG